MAFKDQEKGQELIKAIEAGSVDFVSVAAVDRLGRNLYDVLTTLEYFNENNVILRVDTLGLESMVDGNPNQVFKLIISVLGNVADLERTNLGHQPVSKHNLAEAIASLLVSAPSSVILQ